jgi:hypothetical protein
VVVVTWTKIDANFLVGPQMQSVGRGARLLHIEATAWCNTHGTDGEVPRYMLARISDEPDPERAAAELVKAGLWAARGNEGWMLADFADNQPSAADVQRTQRLWRDRQRRQRQHRSGDHSLCDPRYCRAASVTGDSPVSHDARTEPIRSVPSRKSDGEVSGVGGSADRSRARPAATPPRPSPTARKAKGEAAPGLARVPVGDGSGRQVALTTGNPKDEHITIAVDPDGAEVAANATLLRDLAAALSSDLRDARRLHRCPRREGNRRRCQAILIGEGLEDPGDLDEDEDEAQGPPSAAFDVPAEYSKAWLETISWELQHGVGAQPPEGDQP